MMWIKICGMTSADAISAAAAANVDAIGFVFAPSPRQVTPGQAAQLAALAPPGILRIAVAQHPLQMKVDEICRILKPDYFQTDVEDLRELKIPAHIKVLSVVRFGRKTPHPLPPRIVFEGPSSGIGELADWGRAAELARQTELILAGGLSAQNVAEAVQAVRPFGVDVSSGVEVVPGVKDPDKIYEFVRAARAAAAQLEHDASVLNPAAHRSSLPRIPTPRAASAPSAAAMCRKPWCPRSIACKPVSTATCTVKTFKPSSTMN
jgi:phosphoribosylanthranilate isomerase